jgi:hypothetical protein
VRTGWVYRVAVTGDAGTENSATAGDYDFRQRAALALLPLSTGAAVLVTILLFHDSLFWPTLILVAGSAGAALLAARRLRGSQRRYLARRAVIGAIAGLAATAVYDLVRYGAVAAFSWSVDPFAAFPLFGRLLVGQGRDPALLWSAGIVFHLLNGLGFAIGYTLLIPRPRIVTAVAWAMALESVTILVYPDWLGITAVGEFFSMSMLGHLGYGVTLGKVAQICALPDVTMRVEHGRTTGGAV